MKKVFIVGINGQDGHYLARYLNETDYQLFGTDIKERGDLPSSVNYFKGSIADHSFLTEILLDVKPDMIFNLASISQVSDSYNMPEETYTINVLAVIRMLEIIRKNLKTTRFLQASSSEIFGGNANPPYDENSVPIPLSPYAVSKLAAYYMVKIYRKDFNLFTANAILFNHTSPRHSSNFVIPKIIRGLVEIKLGKVKKISLGNLDIVRDWGYAEDYVKAMVSILNYFGADDFVVGTGVPTTLKEIVQYVLKKLNLSYNDVIKIDTDLFRLNEPMCIYSNPSKIKNELGWRPEKSLRQILDVMIEAEIVKQKK